MSHVATIDIHIKDIGCLKKACERLGLVFRENQGTYKWFGRHVGDYPLPEGFSKEDLGKCEHAIGIKGNENAYEVGVVRRRDGKPGYQLTWDFWAGGHGLEKAVGENCNRLKQAYAVNVAKKKARAQGMSVREKVNADGSIQLVCQ